MSLVTVEGIYKDGKVELTERPAHSEETARVLVTFLPANRGEEKPVSEQGQDRETLRQQAFEQMREGFHFGGPPYPKREDLYDRFER